MGETELVLDTLAVDDALRMLGALKGSGPTAPKQTNTNDAAEPRRQTPSETTSPHSASSPVASPANSGDGSDWRDALRASGAAPSELAKRRVTAPDTPITPATPPSMPLETPAAS